MDDSDSDSSAMDSNSYMFYENTKQETDDEILDDIPHVMDPVVEKFIKMEKAKKASNMKKSKKVSGGCGKKKITEDLNQKKMTDYTVQGCNIYLVLLHNPKQTQ